MSDDRAPTVYLDDGTPVKVRIVGATCEGDVSGEGHFGYDLKRPSDTLAVYFDEVDE